MEIKQTHYFNQVCHLASVINLYCEDLNIKNNSPSENESTAIYSNAMVQSANSSEADNGEKYLMK